LGIINKDCGKIFHYRQLPWMISQGLLKPPRYIFPQCILTCGLIHISVKGRAHPKGLLWTQESHIGEIMTLVLLNIPGMFLEPPTFFSTRDLKAIHFWFKAHPSLMCSRSHFIKCHKTLHCKCTQVDILFHLFKMFNIFCLPLQKIKLKR
jgi:hypothetical protein